MAAFRVGGIPKELSRQTQSLAPSLSFDENACAKDSKCFTRASTKLGGAPLERSIKKMRGIRSGGAILMPRTVGVSDQVGTRGAAKRGERLALPKRPVGGGAAGQFNS